MQMDKGKDVVPSPPVHDHPNTKQGNYVHYHEEAGPNHFCKVIFASKLEAMSLPLDFTMHFPAVPTEFSLKTNTDSSWRVTVMVVDGRVTLDQGWATFAVVHQVRIVYMLTFKLLTPNTMKVIVFNDDDVEVVTKCKKHDEAFAMAS
ncbi:U-box domain-containing protein 4 [Hordeum vulgare]|nr:U-box domain-containing protein 4 [Hordeum vulgare]